MWLVYILRCSNGSLYTGITNNLKRRLDAHNTGTASAYTRSHLPVRVIYTKRVRTKSEALKREAKIKSWKRLQKITQLGLSI